MLTRCPKCATTFRVTSEQLKARQGRVRCGACQEVFSALDTLVEEVLPGLSPMAVAQPDMAVVATATEEPEMVVTPPLEPSLDDSPPVAPVPDVDLDTPVMDVAPEPIAEREPEFERPPEPQPQPEITAESVAMPEPAIEPVAKFTSIRLPKLEAATAPWPEPEPQLHEEAPRRKWPWAVGLCAAMLVFSAQIAVAFRTEIIVLYPETKPTFATICAATGCELTLPRKAELVGIEDSDLHPDPSGRLTLVATLKNRAPFAQEFPYLELTLTDTADQPLVRRVLAPAEYLPPKTAADKGFGANTEIAVNLAIEAPGIPAAGYRLYLFYP